MQIFQTPLQNDTWNIVIFVASAIVCTIKTNFNIRDWYKKRKFFSKVLAGWLNESNGDERFDCG